MKKLLLLLSSLSFGACVTAGPYQNDPAAPVQSEATRPVLYGLGAGATCAAVGALTAPDGKKGRYARNAGLICGAAGGIAGSVVNAQERQKQQQYGGQAQQPAAVPVQPAPAQPAPGQY